MAENKPQLEKPSRTEVVSVTDWVACHNSNDNFIVLSCTVTSADSSAGITGVGLILNTHDGTTLASFYTALSSGSEIAYPALNLTPGEVSVGDNVSAVAQGEWNGQHFFFEQDLTISNC
ncbi:MAG: hypothetical protein AABN95_18975 [Acidobacteriota bacterium]